MVINPTVGVYIDIIYKDSLYIKGGMTIPNIRSGLDPDTYPVFHVQAVDRS